MSAKINTQFGHAVPPAPPHSITVHMPKWETIDKFNKDPMAVFSSLKNVYPRMKPHKDIAELAVAVMNYLGEQNQTCLLLPSLQTAKECVQYASSPKRNTAERTAVPPDQMRIRAMRAKDQFFAVTFANQHLPLLLGFWRNPGVGVSSRFAQANLEYIQHLSELPVSEVDSAGPAYAAPIHEILRSRIIQYLGRAALHPESSPRPTTNDVYFFSTGMSSIYKPHAYLLNSLDGTTVIFGMVFMSTIATFEDVGKSCKFFGLGTDEDLRDLETFLEDERKHDRKVQAIWTEFPANPILVTPNLSRLRKLADEYDTILVVDDTIGSFANIDVMAMADILVTSLTKSFNGYADVIAGSATLNPAGRKYQVLKSLFEKNYVPELYVGDVEALERNSRDYLSRTTKLNHNASSLVRYLQTCVDDPDNAVSKVHYPEINPSGRYYREFMRKATDELSPGFGCLFNVEFESVPAAKAFYDEINIHEGPHLGAPFTLAFAYTAFAYGTKLDWAAQYGLRPTQIRISAGMEETDVLIEDFRLAVEAANNVKHCESK